MWHAPGAGAGLRNGAAWGRSQAEPELRSLGRRAGFRRHHPDRREEGIVVREDGMGEWGTGGSVGNWGGGEAEEPKRRGKRWWRGSVAALASSSSSSGCGGGQPRPHRARVRVADADAPLSSLPVFSVVDVEDNGTGNTLAVAHTSRHRDSRWALLAIVNFFQWAGQILDSFHIITVEKVSRQAKTLA